MEEEQKWIRDIQRRGSRQAADKLVRTYYDEIYRFAYRQLGHKASFRTWLYRIAAHKAIDCRRKVQGNILLLEETETPDQTDFAAQIQDRDLLDRMEEYISRLDPDTQAVYRLRLYGERTFPEIAAVLGQPEAAVKTRYYRLMARLRKEFG
ncbi:RNA polymerase subunit sigma-24 [Flavonifractor sp. An82]|uniref:RNA polymerase sigma factor n=1 Tax=Flavonifractor sp. An82 TaxID=1965660 RepID=UPI000B38E812|nr:RNA polymerase sigma factor [Flavonifractor sp. An82]OUN21382.1 RNA polymerase subunit sigma-24 [Flavonifractor sp. An82]